MVQDVLSMPKLYTDENNITYYSEGNTKYYFKFYQAGPLAPIPTLLSGWTDEMNKNLTYAGEYGILIIPIMFLKHGKIQ